MWKPRRGHSRQEKWQSKQAIKRETSWHVWGAASSWAGWSGVNKETRSQDPGQETARSGLVGSRQGDRSLDVLWEGKLLEGSYMTGGRWGKYWDSYETLRQSKWKMMLLYVLSSFFGFEFMVFFLFLRGKISGHVRFCLSTIVIQQSSCLYLSFMLHRQDYEVI